MTVPQRPQAQACTWYSVTLGRRWRCDVELLELLHARHRSVGQARAALPAGRRRAHHRVIRAGQEDSDSRPEERPSYISAGAAGAVWQAKDLPMYLHIFAYMTRGALLNWWFSPTAA